MDVELSTILPVSDLLIYRGQKVKLPLKYLNFEKGKRKETVSLGWRAMRKSRKYLHVKYEVRKIETSRDKTKMITR